MKLEFVALFIAVTLSCAFSSGVSQDGAKATKDLVASETADAQIILPPVKGKLVQTFTYNSRDEETATEEQNVTVSDGKRKNEVVSAHSKLLPNKLETARKLPDIEPIRVERQNLPAHSQTPPDFENISLPLPSPQEKERGKVNIKNIVVYNLTQEELKLLKNSDNKNRLDILKSISQKGGTVINPFNTGNNTSADSRKSQIASMFLNSALKGGLGTPSDISSISRRFSSAPPILIQRNVTNDNLFAEENLKNRVKISSRDSIPPEVVQYIMKNIPLQFVNQQIYQNQKRENQQLVNENSLSPVQTNYVSKSQNGKGKQQIGIKKQQPLKRLSLLPKPVSQVDPKNSLIRKKKIQSSLIPQQKTQQKLTQKSDLSSQTQLFSNYERSHPQFDRPEKEPIHTLSEDTKDTHLPQRKTSEQQNQSKSFHLHQTRHDQPKGKQNLKLATVQKNYRNSEQSSGKPESREIKSQAYEINPVTHQLTERTERDSAAKQHQKREQNDILDSYLNLNIQALPSPKADNLGEATSFPINFTPEIEVHQINIPSAAVAPGRQFESLTGPIIHPRFQQSSPRTSTVFVPQTVTVTQTVTKTVASGKIQGPARLPITFTKTETLYPPIRAPFLSNGITETVFVQPTACTPAHALTPNTRTHALTPNTRTGTSSYVNYYGENLQHPVIDPPETFGDWMEKSLSAESPFFIDQYGVPRNGDALTGPAGMRFPKSFVIDERIWQI